MISTSRATYWAPGGAGCDELLDDLQQHTTCKRRCMQLRRRVRRRPSRSKEELRRLLTEHGAELKWFEPISRGSDQPQGLQASCLDCELLATAT